MATDVAHVPFEQDDQGWAKPRFFEPLEDRLLLSVTDDGLGVLTLIGQVGGADDWQVLIEADGAVTVTGDLDGEDGTFQDIDEVRIDGGDGSDTLTLTFGDERDNVNVQFNKGQARVTRRVRGMRRARVFVDIARVETVTIEGAGGDDKIKSRNLVTTGIATLTLSGGDGNDRLIAQSTAILSGDDGDDRLNGSDGNDTLLGGAGNDRLLGRRGNDMIDGEAGDDRANGMAGNDTINGGIGNDRLQGGSDDDLLFGDAGDDDLRGNNGDDIMTGGAGDDIIRGGKGNNTAGYTTAVAGVVIDLRERVTTDDGQGGRDLLRGVNSVDGSLFDDMITGNKFANQLIGSDGDDVLIGLRGDDLLIGGAGPGGVSVLDTLDGGPNDDRAEAGAQTIDAETVLALDPLVATGLIGPSSLVSETVSELMFNVFDIAVPTAEFNRAIELVDLDENGLIDLVTASFDRFPAADTFSVSLNNGDTTFQAPREFTMDGVNPVAIASGDLNNDGDRDIVIANLGVFDDMGTVTQAGSITVVFGSGAADEDDDDVIDLFSSIAQFETGSFVDLAIADLDNDGNRDVIAIDFLTGEVVQLFGDGDGDFEKEGSFFNAADLHNAVAVADLNDDGNPDIVTANTASLGVSVWLSDGARGLSGPTVFDMAGLRTTDVALGDVNGDGVPDAVVVGDVEENLPGVQSEDSRLLVLTGDGDGSFTLLEPQDIDPVLFGNAGSLALGDLDQNNILDVAVTNFTDDGLGTTTNQVNVLSGLGSGVFVQAATLTGTGYAGVGKPDAVAIGRSVSSPIPDVFVADHDNDGVTLMFILPS